MDSTASQSLSIPRLRLTRHSQVLPFDEDASNSTPTAGPSRLSPNFTHLSANGEHDEHDDLGDSQSTPRVPLRASLSSPKTTPLAHFAPTEDTPAARLRALLARVPNSSTSASQTQLLHEPAPHTPSELDSDFDTPKWNTTAASVARESLKDLFSRALREPGDTPRGSNGKRRNSIDTSEVEDSPRVEKVAEERAKNKGKRMSLSDEELDKPSKTSKRPNIAGRSIYASNIDALRNRLANSYADGKDFSVTGSDHSLSDMYMSDGPVDKSDNTPTLLRHLNSSVASPPAASSTPMRSVQFPSQIQMQSNLLDQDSEMQRAMGATDTSESETVPNGRPLSFPPLRNTKASAFDARPAPALARAGSLPEDRLKGNASGNTAKNMSRRVSADSAVFSSRPSSDMSLSDYMEPAPGQPGTPAKDNYQHHRVSHTHTGTPLPEVRQRRDSMVSIRSFDSDFSSRTGSVVSNADYRERVRDSDRERIIERERAWNSPRARLSSTRSSSSLSNNQDSDRIRKYSRPSRPESSHSTPDRIHFSQQPSRTSSPTGSVRSSNADEGKQVVERERNWNSPQPKWKQKRSLSPIPPAAPPPKSSPGHSRIRTQSLVAVSPKTPSRDSPEVVRLRKVSESSPSTARVRSPHAVSPSPHLDASSPPHRQDNSIRLPPSPNSPNSPASPKVNGNPQGTGTPSFASYFGWKFPRNRAQLPPLDLEESSTERSPSHPHKSSGHLGSSSRPSHIPVRSPSGPKTKPQTDSSPAQSPDADDSAFKKGHKRTTTEFNEANGALPRRINVVESELKAVSPETGHTDLVQESDEDAQTVATPIIRPVDSLPSEQLVPANSPSPSPPVHSNISRSEKGFGSSRPQDPVSTTPPSSPPPRSEPSEEVVSALSTPPRHFSFSTSKIEFQTPSPPKGLPDLPEIPLLSEDDGANEEIQDQTPGRMNGNGVGNGLIDFSSMKTPKPPGGWAATPAPVRKRDADIPVPSATNGMTRSREGTSEIENPSFCVVESEFPPLADAAPPGAWYTTPGTVRRRSIMKVRFEVSDSTPSESGDAAESKPLPEIKFQIDDSDASGVVAMPVELDVSVSEPSFNGVRQSSPIPSAEANGNGNGNGHRHVEEAAKPEPPKTPAHSHSSRRKSRKSPSIRLVDEYGQERREDAPATPKGKEVSVSMRMPGGSLQTPRNKSANRNKNANKSVVRMLDAMGREVEESQEQDDSDDTVTEGPIGRAEALARVKKAVNDLQEGLSEVDRSTDRPLDDARLSELHDVSKAAREARSRISKSLKQAQDTQTRLRSNYGPLRESMRRAKFLPDILPQRRFSWNPWSILSIFILQILLVIFMYRIALHYAKLQFLTTYFDPFYGNLHLLPTKPDAVYDPNQFTFYRFSIGTSITERLEQLGAGPFVAVWKGAMETIARWQRLIWDAWGVPDEVQYAGVRSWPPT